MESEVPRATKTYRALVTMFKAHQGLSRIIKAYHGISSHENEGGNLRTREEISNEGGDLRLRLPVGAKAFSDASDASDGF